MSAGFLQLERFEPPEWAKHLTLMPSQRCQLAMLPTPIHRWHLPGLPSGVEVWIKRDDMTGMQMSGNKVRKLEFLMADAKARGADCVVTIGGIQSNHCRATAVAARYLGLDCHLILRMSRTEAAEGHDPGLVGNLLLDRMVGATIHKVTKEEYVAKGGVALAQQLEASLRAEGRTPYVIPVGGSNSLGTWGYLLAVDEMQQQQEAMLAAAAVATAPGGLTDAFTDVVMACGSGGTTAGLALGCYLSGFGGKVHAYAVCDDPDYFYAYVDGLLAGLGPGQPASRSLVTVVQAKGQGYALSTREELQTVMEVAQATGVVLDPVYSGKAIHGLLADMRREPAAWAGKRVLFVHTGGLLGMYDKVDQLQSIMAADTAGVRRLAVA